MARAEEPVLVGFGNDRTREVRALLAVGDEGRRVEAYQETRVGRARIGERFGGPDGKLNGLSTASSVPSLHQLAAASLPIEGGKEADDGDCLLAPRFLRWNEHPYCLYAIDP